MGLLSARVGKHELRVEWGRVDVRQRRRVMVPVWLLKPAGVIVSR